MEANLTPKQIEILELVAEGFTSEEIAKKLGNSKKTIDAMRHDMLSRTQAKNMANLVAISFRNNWIK